MISADELANRFTYHAPKDQAQIDKFVMIRQIALSYATVINEYAPDGREKSLAITKLEEVVFWTNASIARGE